MKRSGRILSVFALSAGALMGPALHAQDGWKYRAEAFGSVGTGRFYNGGDKWGSGMQLGGGLGLRPFDGALGRLGFEARVHNLDFKRTPSATHSTVGQASSIAAGVLWHFSDSSAQPYMVADLGIMRTSFTRKGISKWYDANPDGTLGEPHVEQWVEQDKVSQFLWGLGVGLKIRVVEHIYLRPELRFDTTTAGRGWNFATVRLAMACGYYW